MNRFAAMIWDPAVETRTAQVERWSKHFSEGRWRRVYDRPGLCVFALAHRGPQPVTANIADAGVIIGPLFARGGEAKGRVRQLSPADARAVIADGGQSLVVSHWGNYVAFWRDQTKASTFVLRDPCGGVACFTTEALNVTLVFSHADDVARLPGISWSIDWTYLQSFLVFNYFVTPMTGLRGVTELLAGERLRCAQRLPNERAFVWNGAAIASSPHRLDFAATCEEAASLGRACFSAWGGEYRSILVSLSGGLDSSILINLMRRTSSAELAALHYVGAGYESYELKLARLAAAHADVSLIELEQDPAREMLTRTLTAPLLARPKVQSLAVLIDELSHELAERLGAEAFMLGHGGDNLFLQRGAALHTLADYVRLEGLGQRFWRTTYDAACLKQHSLWHVLAEAIGEGLNGRRWRPYQILERGDWTSQRPLTNTAAQALPDQYKIHPWLAQAARLPAGKGEHLSSVVALYNYHFHHGRGLERDVIYPFFSQPLVEHLLKTPTYVLAHGGLDRAVERAAFGDLIPSEILRRTGKSGADHYLLKVLQHHFAFFRELILDGQLIRQDWIARDRVEKMLAPGFASEGGGALFIYLLAAAEAWLTSWRTRLAAPGPRPIAAEV